MDDVKDISLPGIEEDNLDMDLDMDLGEEEALAEGEEEEQPLLVAE